MWSGPRTISTAMMRAWENRPDTVVWDEPLYAHYLKQTGIDHPMRDEVLAAYETDWRKVVERVTGPVPDGRRIHYQKHITLHFVGEIEWQWLDRLSNCFLIRDPREVIASYIQKRDADVVTMEDIGFKRQAEIFDYVRKRGGRVPPVIDARDVLTDPGRMLGLLCDALDLPFDAAMLEWPPGPRPSDGPWARHWYDGVERSTGFAPYKPAPIELPDSLRGLAQEAEGYYRRLYKHRL